jgi:hypothetical protein
MHITIVVRSFLLPPEQKLSPVRECKGSTTTRAPYLNQQQYFLYFSTVENKKN